MNNSKIAFSMKGITKIYPGVIALNDVSIEFREGEVHAIVGENGAGKSTLIKTLAGAIQPERGEIIFGETSYTHMTPALSRSLGVEVIYQEYNLIPPLSAAENIFLGEKTGRLVNYKAMNAGAQSLFDEFKINIDPSTPVKDLSSAEMQIVEIAKAVSKRSRIVVMDEPTAPLTAADVSILMNMIQTMKQGGATVIYISHRLEEIFEISDRVTVLRDGQYIKTLNTADTNRQELINLMVGRELTETYPQRTHALGDVSLELDHVYGNGDRDISFAARSGEVLGISGLVGSGRTELMHLLCGNVPVESGTISIHGEPVRLNGVKDGIRHGVGLIPEDRKRQGCLLTMPIKWNCSIMCIRDISRSGVVSSKKENELADYYKEKFRIKAPGTDTVVGTLSGGNQQKVVLAKTLAANPDIILFDEPTRGIDVGARYEIYLLMNELAASGKTILMVTSDMEELLGMSDRVVVLCEGGMAGIVEKKDFSQSRILDLASGGSELAEGACAS